MLERERIGPAGRVGDARGVGEERLVARGGVVAARGVGEQRLDSRWPFGKGTRCLRSAPGSALAQRDTGRGASPLHDRPSDSGSPRRTSQPRRRSRRAARPQRPSSLTGSPRQTHRRLPRRIDHASAGTSPAWSAPPAAPAPSRRVAEAPGKNRHRLPVHGDRRRLAEADARDDEDHLAGRQQLTRDIVNGQRHPVSCAHRSGRGPAGASTTSPPQDGKRRMMSSSRMSARDATCVQRARAVTHSSWLAHRATAPHDRWGQPVVSAEGKRREN